MEERRNAGGRVEIARCVAEERLHAGGRVVATIDVVIKCINTVGCVEIAGGIAEEGTDTGSRVLMAIGVGEEGAESLCGVVVAGIVMKERLKTKSRIIDAAGQALKCLTSLSGIVPRIAAVRRWADRLRKWAKGSGAKCQRLSRMMMCRFFIMLFPIHCLRPSPICPLWGVSLTVH